MTNEQILEKQVEALEKLLQLRSAIIEELESKVNKLEAERIMNQPYIPVNPLPWMQPAQPFIGGGSLQIDPNAFNCPDGTPHDYPNMWGGTQPPSCKKCGRQSQFSTTTTCQNGTSHVPVHTSGYIQPVDIAHDPSVKLYSSSDQAVESTNVFTLSNVAK